MDQTYGTKKYDADKIALLGLFVVALLIAHFITSARYTRPHEAGTQIVAEIKRRGISSFLDERGWQSFFLIKNAAGRPIGFAMDLFTDAASENRLNIQSAAVLYTRGRPGREQFVSFKSDNRFDEFSWESEATGPRRKSHKQVRLEKDGVLTVTEFGRNTAEAAYKPPSTSIPDFMLDFVFSQLLETSHTKIIVDAISAEGKILEVVISREITRDSGPTQAEPQHRLNVKFFGDRQLSQDVLLDSRGRVMLVRLRQKGTYFERTSAENILREFPESAAYILQKNNMLQQNRP